MSSIRQRTKAKRMRIWGLRQFYVDGSSCVDLIAFVGYTNDWHDTFGWEW